MDDEARRRTGPSSRPLWTTTQASSGASSGPATLAGGSNVQLPGVGKTWPGAAQALPGGPWQPLRVHPSATTRTRVPRAPQGRDSAALGDMPGAVRSSKLSVHFDGKGNLAPSRGGHRGASERGWASNQGEPGSTRHASAAADYVYRPPAFVKALWDVEASSADEAGRTIHLSAPRPGRVRLLASPLAQALGCKEGFFLGRIQLPEGILILDRFDGGSRRGRLRCDQGLAVPVHPAPPTSALEPTLLLPGDVVFALSCGELPTSILPPLVDGAGHLLRMGADGRLVTITTRHLDMAFELRPLPHPLRIVPTLLVVDFLLAGPAPASAGAHSGGTATLAHGYITLDQKRHVYCMTERDALSSALEYVGLWIKWEPEGEVHADQAPALLPLHLLWSLCLRFVQCAQLRKMNPTRHQFLCLLVPAVPWQRGKPVHAFYEVRYDPEHLERAAVRQATGEAAFGGGVAAVEVVLEEGRDQLTPISAVSGPRTAVEVQPSAPLVERLDVLSKASGEEELDNGASPTAPDLEQSVHLADTSGGPPPDLVPDVPGQPERVDANPEVPSANLYLPCMNYAVPKLEAGNAISAGRDDPVDAMPASPAAPVPTLSALPLPVPPEQYAHYLQFLQQQLLALSMAQQQQQHAVPVAPRPAMHSVATMTDGPRLTEVVAVCTLPMGMAPAATCVGVQTENLGGPSMDVAVNTTFHLHPLAQSKGALPSEDLAVEAPLSWNVQALTKALTGQPQGVLPSLPNPDGGEGAEPPAARRIAGLVGDPDASFLCRSSEHSMTCSSQGSENSSPWPILTTKLPARCEVSSGMQDAETPSVLSLVEPYSVATMNYLKKYQLLPTSNATLSTVLPSTYEEEEEEEEEEDESSAHAFPATGPISLAVMAASPLLHDARIRGMRKLH